MELLDTLKLTDQQDDEQINLTIELGYKNVIISIAFALFQKA